MRLPKRYENVSGFAVCCTRENMEPKAVAELLCLRERAASAICREASEPGANADRERDRVCTAAGLLGLRVHWPGPWAELTRADDTAWVRVEFSADNAAFEAQPGAECARILRALADRFEAYGSIHPHTPTAQTIRDVNGNTIGRAEVHHRRQGEEVRFIAP